MTERACFVSSRYKKGRDYVAAFCLGLQITQIFQHPKYDRSASCSTQEKCYKCTWRSTKLFIGLSLERLKFLFGNHDYLPKTRCEQRLDSCLRQSLL